MSRLPVIEYDPIVSGNTCAEDFFLHLACMRFVVVIINVCVYCVVVAYSAVE